MGLSRATHRVRTSVGELAASLAMLRTLQPFTLNILARFSDPTLLHALVVSWFNSFIFPQIFISELDCYRREA